MHSKMDYIMFSEIEINMQLYYIQYIYTLEQNSHLENTFRFKSNKIQFYLFSYIWDTFNFLA